MKPLIINSTVLAKQAQKERLYNLNAFPQLNVEHIKGLLRTRSVVYLEKLFEQYLLDIEPQLTEQNRKKILSQVERVRRDTVNKFKKAIDSYAIDISGVSPKGF